MSKKQNNKKDESEKDLDELIAKENQEAKDNGEFLDKPLDDSLQVMFLSDRLILPKLK